MNEEKWCNNCVWWRRKDTLGIDTCDNCEMTENGPSCWIKEVNLEDKPDMVNHPNHYKTKSGLETINVIETFTEDLTGIEAVCTANVIKYICRWKKKNGLEDLKKAEWYLTHLIEKEEKENK